MLRVGSGIRAADFGVSGLGEFTCGCQISSSVGHRSRCSGGNKHFIS